MGVGALMYHVKEERKSTEMDIVCASLQPLKASIPPTSHLYYLMCQGKKQRYASSEYCLAPVFLQLDHNNKIHDSTLLVIPVTDTDSVAYYKMSAGKILWENRDSLYHYLLINPR
ncbi:hypothetical protein DN068_01855 [Taibaiella soli]|uniref:Uncharacterized protein n=2 Tax=Taibaiella soli TaxID=1649169 RepID=A0A2W2APM3_9BACT|nr:hypothetical protein DN068_01855 [Taibaiella soli]